MRRPPLLQRIFPGLPWEAEVLPPAARPLARGLEFLGLVLGAALWLRACWPEPPPAPAPPAPAWRAH